MLAAIFSILLAQAAASDQVASPISNPSWVRMPSPTEFSRYYPPEADANGISGHAIVKCQVGADGGMTNCSIVSESPEGLGFGDAMLKIAPHFKMTRLSKSGQPSAGWWINLPAAFNARPVSCPPNPMDHYYPQKAAMAHLDGEAVVNCGVSPAGKFEQCHVASEEPASQGFGGAARMLAECVMKPKPGFVVNAAGRVEIPVHFKLPK